MTGSMAGRVALVTGASQGIGAAIADAVFERDHTGAPLVAPQLRTGRAANPSVALALHGECPPASGTIWLWPYDPAGPGPSSE